LVALLALLVAGCASAEIREVQFSVNLNLNVPAGKD
jgi:hypothetical protein